MILHLLYFARLREQLGVADETLECDAETVAGMLAQLRARGGVWDEVLAPGRNFRVAVNQNLATPETPLAEDAEVAIFPPVTGG